MPPTSAESVEAAIAAVLTSSKKPRYLRETGWLDDTAPAELKQLYESFTADCDEAVKVATAKLGPPAHRAKDRWFKAEYPEAFAGAAWSLPRGRTLFVVADHHERDTPMALSVFVRS